MKLKLTSKVTSFPSSQLGSDGQGREDAGFFPGLPLPGPSFLLLFLTLWDCWWLLRGLEMVVGGEVGWESKIWLASCPTLLPPVSTGSPQVPFCCFFVGDILFWGGFICNRWSLPSFLQALTIQQSAGPVRSHFPPGVPKGSGLPSPFPSWGPMLNPWDTAVVDMQAAPSPSLLCHQAPWQASASGLLEV